MPKQSVEDAAVENTAMLHEEAYQKKRRAGVTENLAAEKILKSKMLDVSHDVKVVSAVLHAALSVQHNVYTGPEHLAIATVDGVLGTTHGQAQFIVTGYMLQGGGTRLAGSVITRTPEGSVKQHTFTSYQSTAQGSVRGAVYDATAKWTIESLVESCFPG